MILATDEITLLVEHMRRVGVGEIEITDGADRLSLVLPGNAAPGAAVFSAPVPPGRTIIAAASCGVFVPQHPLREGGAEIGTEVRAGEVVALISVGAIYQPVVAPRAGTLAAVLREPGDRVDFGTPLFELAP